MTNKYTLKQRKEYRLVALWLKPELLAQIDARANGNRSEYIRKAVAEKLEREKEQKCTTRKKSIYPD